MTQHAEPDPAPTGSTGDGVTDALTPDHRVIVVHRVGAVVVALVLAVFGALGLVGGLGFFDTTGAPVMGLSTNGLLSSVSLVTAAALIAAAVRGGRFASTVMLTIGVLFLVSAFANLAVLGSGANLLAFRLPNVFFSIGAGLVLLVLGAYGRVSSKLPVDNPYALERRESEGSAEDGDSRASQDRPEQPRPASNAEHRADQEMAAAARAVATGTATPGQHRALAAVDGVRSHEERRRIWMDAARDDGAAV